MAVKIIPRKVEIDEFFVVRDDGIYAYPRKVDALQTITEINPNKFALVQEDEKARYAISMSQRFNGFNRIDTHVKVLKSGLFVPKASIFIPHYKHVNEALQGRGVLYDASGNLIESGRLSKYAYTLNYNCWVRLNAFFKKGKGFLDLDLVTIEGIDNGNPRIKRVPLEECLEQDCWAELESINSQGFPTKKSKIEKYEPGKTFYFDYPKDNLEAGLETGEDRAFLGCDRYPTVKHPSLGVFVCVKGA